MQRYECISWQRISWSYRMSSKTAAALFLMNLTDETLVHWYRYINWTSYILYTIEMCWMHCYSFNISWGLSFHLIVCSHFSKAIAPPPIYSYYSNIEHLKYCVCIFHIVLPLHSLNQKCFLIYLNGIQVDPCSGVV